MWRKSLYNDWLKNQDLWTVWSYCLMKASHKKRTVRIGFQKINIEPGQFVFGRKRASEELNLSEWKIRRCIDSLRKSGNVAIKTTNKFSVITIINWELYQGDDNNKNEENRQQTANKPPTNRHRQECKALKNKYSKDFLEFYSAYPLKKSKAKAYQAWKKLKPDLHTCLAALQSLLIERGFLKAEK